jgi:hypothetical protein
MGLRASLPKELIKTSTLSGELSKVIRADAQPDICVDAIIHKTDKIISFALQSILIRPVIALR